MHDEPFIDYQAGLSCTVGTSMISLCLELDRYTSCLTVQLLSQCTELCRQILIRQVSQAVRAGD